MLELKLFDNLLLIYSGDLHGFVVITTHHQDHGLLCFTLIEIAAALTIAVEGDILNRSFMNVIFLKFNSLNQIVDYIRFYLAVFVTDCENLRIFHVNRLTHSPARYFKILLLIYDTLNFEFNRVYQLKCLLNGFLFMH